MILGRGGMLSKQADQPHPGSLLNPLKPIPLLSIDPWHPTSFRLTLAPQVQPMRPLITIRQTVKSPYTAVGSVPPPDLISLDVHISSSPLSKQFCPFTQKCWIALEERGIPYKYVETNPFNKDPALLGERSWARNGNLCLILNLLFPPSRITEPH